MANEWYNRKWAIVATHALVWALLYSLPFLLRPTYEKPTTPAEMGEKVSWFYFLLAFYITQIIFFYTNAFYLIPKLVQQKRIMEYTGVLLLVFMSFCAMRYAFERFYLEKTMVDPKPLILFTVFTFLFILSASTAYQMVRERILMDRKVSARENENLKTELSLLRSQVSPHFMFNVLNNMVSLARKKSDLLEPSLIKLSSLMRYMLYEADEEKMPLQREVEYLQSYIDLQRQRFGKNVDINVEMNVPNNHYEIEPMLLIPFVENAFKHGTGFIMHAQIDINLFTTANKLFFAVRNKYNTASEEVKDKTSGIGLANVKRRLNLLYGNNYVLQINTKDDWFYVTLQLDLH